MKTKASVVKRNPVVSFPNGKKVQTKWNTDGELTIKNNALGQWVDTLNKSDGVFYLQLDALSDANQYFIHYKCNKTGKLMEMQFKGSNVRNAYGNKEYLDALLLDLNLFEGTEPIVVFDKQVFANHFQESFPILCQHTDVIDSIINRVHDLKEVFDTRIYYDTLFKEISVQEIYRVLYNDVHKEQLKIPDSLAMYHIFEALQSIYFQVTGLKVIA